MRPVAVKRILWDPAFPYESPAKAADPEVALTADLVSARLTLVAELIKSGVTALVASPTKLFQASCTTTVTRLFVALFASKATPETTSVGWVVMASFAATPAVSSSPVWVTETLESLARA